MINLISMNITRFFKSKIVFVTSAILMALFVLLTAAETDPEEQELNQKIIEQYDVSEEDMEAGMTLGNEIDSDSSFDTIYRSMVSSGLPLILVGIFAAVYTDDERKSGFLKNISVGRNQKKYIFASKIPVLMIYSTILLLLSIAAVKLGCITRDPSLYRVHDIFKLIGYIFVEILLHTAFGAFIMVVYEVCRNSVITIITAIFASLNLFGTIFSVVESKLSSLGGIMEKFVERFGLVQYLLVTRVKLLEISGSVFPHVNTIVVAVVGLSLYAFLGMLIFSKRDTY